MRRAENEPAIGRQKSVRHEIEWMPLMRTVIDEALHRIAPTYKESTQRPITRTHCECASARISKICDTADHTIEIDLRHGY
jgi:hypothetical protein